MTLKRAIKLLEREYERAKTLKFVRKTLAYALFKVWKIAVGEEEHCANCDSTKILNKKE